MTFPLVIPWRGRSPRTRNPFERASRGWIPGSLASRGPRNDDVKRTASLRPPLAADQPLRQQDRDREVAVECHVAARRDHLFDLAGLLDPVGEEARELEHRLGD